MKRFYFVFAWILLTLGVILSSSAALQLGMVSSQNQETMATPSPSPELAQAVTSNQGQVKGIETMIEVADARPTIVARFLERHNSPLEPYDHFGEVFVSIADQYGFDFRLLPAIAMQESNLCKKIPAGSYNCLGFGIHERGTLTFDSFEANFERAGRELKQYYIDQGRETPEEIMKKYTPGSNGSWAESVNQWMAEMRYDDRQKGRDSDSSQNVLEFAQPSPIEGSLP